MKTSAKIANILTAAGLGYITWCLLRHRSRNSDGGDSNAVVVKPAGDWPNPTAGSVGYRNNNPLNIEYNANTTWQGEIHPSAHYRFCQFTAMAYGYRAAFIMLFNYERLHGCKTLKQIINRWDSGSTNYVATVCKFTGWNPDKVINRYDKNEMVALVTAMSKMENGANQPVPSAAIEQGWKYYQNWLG